MANLVAEMKVSKPEAEKLAALPLEESIGGFRLLRDAIDSAAQVSILQDCRNIIRAAPLVRPMTGWGKPMSVRMTSAGACGWVIDRGRYRYSSQHPETGRLWPEIPQSILKIWRDYSGWPDDPHCCLVNWYDASAKMGLHQDKDEDAFQAPVLSVSLGDSARFRIGGLDRKDPTCSTILSSGDVVVMAGEARLCFHGVDRIVTDGPENPLTGRGRINLTLRVVSERVLAKSRN
ncbi:MAG: alpha-ketoglutarate-dependent dioxygenase AlkB [Pseudomonadota bacterium]